MDIEYSRKKSYKYEESCTYSFKMAMDDKLGFIKDCVCDKFETLNIIVGIKTSTIDPKSYLVYIKCDITDYNHYNFPISLMEFSNKKQAKKEFKKICSEIEATSDRDNYLTAIRSINSMDLF